jgi:hypothetical protein
MPTKRKRSAAHGGISVMLAKFIPKEILYVKTTQQMPSILGCLFLGTCLPARDVLKGEILPEIGGCLFRNFGDRSHAVLLILMGLWCKDLMLHALGGLVSCNKAVLQFTIF